MNTGKKRVEIAILCGILALSATLLSGSVFAADPPEAGKNTEVAENTDNRSLAMKARDFAVEKAGGGVVLEYELDYEGGVKVYDFKIINGETVYEIDVCEDSSGNMLVCAYETEKAKKKDLDLAASYEEIKNSVTSDIQFLETCGELAKYELDLNNGNVVYKSTVIDANGEKRFFASVVSASGERSLNEITPEKIDSKKDTRKKETQPMPNVAISYDAAIAVINEKLNGEGMTVKEWELESERGAWKYEFEVFSGGKEYDIEINADTGEIIEFEIDD